MVNLIIGRVILIFSLIANLVAASVIYHLLRKFKTFKETMIQNG